MKCVVSARNKRLQKVTPTLQGLLVAMGMNTSNDCNDKVHKGLVEVLRIAFQFGQKKSGKAS